MPNRWWTYQAERFPLAGHGPLIAAFSFSAVSFSCALRGGSFPRLDSIAVASLSSLIFFLQLRIADEFKDYEEDAKFRPYRPVPRGLVTRRELGVVFVIGALVQLALALWLQPRLLVLLGLTWGYLAAMSKEFFVRSWLEGRPTVYMVSHMFILPLIDLYATSADWMLHDQRAPSGLVWFLLASFFNGIVIEIGRKVRSPEDEEAGVNTYSVIWGRRNAVRAWWAAATGTLICAAVASAHVNTASMVAIIITLTAVLGAMVIQGSLFVRTQKPGAGKSIEHAAGIWTFVLYVSLGSYPLLLRDYV